MPWLIMAAMLLSACEQVNGFRFGPFGGAAAEEPGAGAPRSAGLSASDFEAPEIFQVTDSGLWDGRPSLGGIWVAHPDVTDPERVIIRNEANGSSVIGALFRRERESPGPALQVSSDAAESLQMLAGAPAVLNVTALRRAEAGGPSDTDTTDTTAAAPINTTPIDGESPAASTLDLPFVQAGIFGIEENADEAAALMQTNDIPARVVRQDGAAGAFWRVIAGPTETETERSTLLTRVTALGFDDAYAVRN